MYSVKYCSGSSASILIRYNLAVLVGKQNEVICTELILHLLKHKVVSCH